MLNCFFSRYICLPRGNFFASYHSDPHTSRRNRCKYGFDKRIIFLRYSVSERRQKCISNHFSGTLITDDARNTIGKSINYRG